MAETAIIAVMTAIKPCGLVDGLVTALTIRTPTSNRNWTSRSNRARPGPRLPDALASSQMAATPMMKTGIARTCAGFIRPPRTTKAAINTRLPVMWAVKILPRVKKPVRSTMPAMTLSKVGSRFSNCDCAKAPSDGCGEGCVVPESVVAISIFLRPSRPRLRRSVAKVVDGQLRNDETEAHRQNNRDGDHAVGGSRAYELQCPMRAFGKLHDAARHPE